MSMLSPRPIFFVHHGLSDAMITEQTANAYLRRATQLEARATLHLGRPVSARELATYLVDVVRPTVSAATWRLYRSAVSHALELKLIKADDPMKEVESAADRLRQTPPAPPPGMALRTSQLKAKRSVDEDFERIRHCALAGRSPNAEALSDFLDAALLTGLRPCEWRDAVLQRSTTAEFEWELLVRTAKTTNGRGNGPSRTIRFKTLESNLLDPLVRWIAWAQTAEREQRFDKAMATIRDLMHDCAVQVFPGRNLLPTPYSCRHHAQARWKALYVGDAADSAERELGRATVAALLGHGNDETATHHYARALRSARAPSRYPVPLACPEQVARVRKEFTHRLASAANAKIRSPECRDDGSAQTVVWITTRVFT